MMQLVYFIATFGAGLIAGSFTEGLLGQMPAKDRLSPEVFVAVSRETSRYVTRYATPLSIVTLIAGILLLLFYRQFSHLQFGLIAAGLVCTVLVIGITVFINLPINKIYQSTPAGSAPANFGEIKKRWNNAHWARTSLAVLGFGLYILALIIH